ncbi:MAG: class I SAM-dependent methyltransferase [Verrucomicrobia bacterium]|nr:class I SAM-dependent methyltransferase [Verrucomicrobiota bacterium]
MQRTICRGCESDKLERFLDLGEMALAGGFLPDTEAIASEEKYPLSTHVCRACGLVQILEVIDPEILFQNYSFSSSTVGPLVQHFQDYAKWLQQKFHPELVVEFGCNDGILLTPLGELGIRSCGIDISENITEIAGSKGLDVLTGYFEESMAERIMDRFGEADVVTGSNTFAHNDHPEIILEAARRVLKPNGHLCLELMYAGDLLEMIQWDTLYHEHLTFYSLSSLQVLLKRCGFHVVDAERHPMHGGSLRVTAALDADEEGQPGVAAILEYERSKALADPDTWINFGQHVDRKIEVVRETLGRLSHNSRIWGYGAAGKATLWVNACRMAYLEAMVDASPLRAGKLMPGTHTPIVFPEELRANPPDYIFISAWNYGDLIRSKEGWFQGIWLVPLPDLRFF